MNKKKNHKEREAYMIGKHISVSILVSMAALSGCRSLPDANLGNCEDLSYDTFVESFEFEIPETLRHRYTLRWRGRVLTANGITQKTAEGSLNVAGYSNSGITLYSARREDGHFEILRNNTGMPDKLLKRSVLSDLSLLYRPLPAEAKCVRRDILDGSLWLRTDRDLAGGIGYFVVMDGQPGWGAIRDEKISFKAAVAQKKSNAPARITIENFYEGYTAEIRFFDESPS